MKNHVRESFRATSDTRTSIAKCRNKHGKMIYFEYPDRCKMGQEEAEEGGGAAAAARDSMHD